MLSQPTSYAIYGLSQLDGPDGLYKQARVIASQGKIPKEYLAKIFIVLVQKGLLESKKGLHGGFRLTRKREEISLFDICEALGDLGFTKRCGLGLKNCSDQNPCPIHDFWKNRRESFINVLKKTSLAKVNTNIIEEKKK